MRVAGAIPEITPFMEPVNQSLVPKSVVRVISTRSSKQRNGKRQAAGKMP
jgi:hypothetical protein